MSLFKSSLNTIVTCITFSLLFSCSEESIPLIDNPDLIFSSSLQIKVPEYFYLGDNDVIYTLQGDKGYETGIPDTVDTSPVFQWNDTLNAKTITMAIFTKPIKTGSNTIINTEDVIWQWHSGEMMNGEAGEVLLSEGKWVENEKILYDTQPLDIKSGLYYWAIWGWSGDGTRIIQSSRPLSFYVQ